MLKKIISLLKDVLLEESEKKLLKFLSKLFNEERVSYFTKISEKVNGVVKKVEDVYNYILPLLDEIKTELGNKDGKYIDDLLLFINKEFTIVIDDKEFSANVTRENLVKYINKFVMYGNMSEWKRETAISWIKNILEENGIKVNESMIRASVEMAVQVLK